MPDCVQHNYRSPIATLHYSSCRKATDKGIQSGRVTGEPVPEAAGPSDADIAATANMSDEQRVEMIRGMVGRLSDRLHAQGADVEGWLRLVRAYVVLGDRDKAKGAADDAKRALGDRPDEIKRIDDLVKGLGLEG